MDQIEDVTSCRFRGAFEPFAPILSVQRGKKSSHIFDLVHFATWHKKAAVSVRGSAPGLARPASRAAS